MLGCELGGLRQRPVELGVFPRYSFVGVRVAVAVVPANTRSSRRPPPGREGIRGGHAGDLDPQVPKT